MNGPPRHSAACTGRRDPARIRVARRPSPRARAPLAHSKPLPRGDITPPPCPCLPDPRRRPGDAGIGRPAGRAGDLPRGTCGGRRTRPPSASLTRPTAIMHTQSNLIPQGPQQFSVCTLQLLPVSIAFLLLLWQPFVLVLTRSPSA